MTLIPKWKALGSVVLVGLLVLFLASSAFPQATIATGAIRGTITDPSGAVVPGATVTVSNNNTGQITTFKTTSSGAFNTGAILPGNYTVKVSQVGFQTSSMPVTVQVGSVASADIKLAVGAASQTVEVSGSALTVNTEQATVQGVLTTQQIENMPINGRNFLDLAQLEPGVQIQDGLNFDPTKGGFTAISTGGRQGRTTRIEVDGLDITDETVGTTTLNLNPAAIQEFQISQSSLDMSSELTSSGAVNIATKPGTNAIHGEAYEFFRHNALSASFPGGQDLPYERNQFGAQIGGPLIKDKLFWSLSGEHTLQHLSSPVTFPAPFESLSGGLPTPFRETEMSGRLDWNINSNARAFYRLLYDNNKGVTNFGEGWALYSNDNNTPSHGFGVDFTTGDWSHSIRIGYLKFHNSIGGVPSPVDLAPGVLVSLGDIGYFSGPNALAPQATFQSNLQGKYDVSRIWGNHDIRMGVALNRIKGGGFASFYGDGPRLRSYAFFASDGSPTDPTSVAYAIANGPYAGGASNPLNYPVYTALLGNGQGYFTETPGFGFPAGGQQDNRLEWYVGDSYKWRKTVTLTYGIRYVRDTGRTNSDLGPVPCSDINTSIFTNPADYSTCTSTIGDMFGPGLGNAVRQDNNNFSPTFGFAWDVGGTGKTVIRGGGGVYYENGIFNNVLFSRPGMLKNGLFWGYSIPCPNDQITYPDGSLVPANLCAFRASAQTGADVAGNRIGDLAATAVADQAAFQSAVAAAGPASNPSFIGNNLAPGYQGVNLYDPNYRTPYSLQMNIGVQRQLFPGAILTADYVRNVSLHFLLTQDVNHVGDVRYFNATAAANAIAATNASFGCGDVNCAIANGASIADYMGNGLDSGNDLFGGVPYSYYGIPSPDDGAAFPGKNPQVGSNPMLRPIGRSVYQGLQTSFKLQKSDLNSLIKNLNLQVSYALSRFESNSGDQDFVTTSGDYANPGRFFGPAAFDRTHQLSFGATVSFPKFFRFSLAQHLSSPLPVTLTALDDFNIFTTDFTGDGTTGDILPSTNIGSLGRSIGWGGLPNVISSFNSNVAGTLTPAGQAVVGAGLMTQAQLVALGGAIQPLNGTVSGYMSQPWVNETDLKLMFPIPVGERFRIEPQVSVYNLFNVANFNVAPNADVQGGELSGALSAGTGAQSVGTVGGTTRADATYFRAFQTPSLFSFAGPRQIEFSLRFVW